MIGLEKDEEFGSGKFVLSVSETSYRTIGFSAPEGIFFHIISVFYSLTGILNMDEEISILNAFYLN